MKTKIIAIMLLISLLAIEAKATDNLSQRLSGRFLLQTEDKGRCWYVNPANLQRYSLGTPTEAYGLMKKIGIGITDTDLANIKDNPLFAKKHAGKIFIQIDNKGAAWYVNPTDLRTYSLGSPILAFAAMRKLSLGISNQNLAQIPIFGYITPVVATPNNPAETTDVLNRAASAFSSANKAEAVECFIPEMKKGIEYSIDNMSKESLFILAGILRGSTLKESNNTKKVYTNQVYFNGTKKDLYFNVVKQSDGTWKITNL